MRLPSIDALLRTPQAQAWLEQWPRSQVLDCLRTSVQEARSLGQEWSSSQLLLRAEDLLQQRRRASLVPVINASGILLHTNLGRAPLSPGALEQIVQLCQGYCNLELDLACGKRGQRERHLQPLLGQLTGCSASLVVNNCAAALMLIVEEFARDREVLVSRGELVEIGGAFRIPDMLAQGGAKLVEVGSTNRTYLEDFARAITPQSALILSTHLSNFVQQGFVHSPEARQLVDLARQANLISVLDLGSGLLTKEGWPEPLQESLVSSAWAQGWDLLTFSGDKLLGGAQAGFILGRVDLLERLAGNPWMRGLRLDKLRYAALQGALLDHLWQPQRLPLTRMLSQSLGQLEQRARGFLLRLGGRLQADCDARLCLSSLGGGTTPGQTLESWAVKIVPESGEQHWAQRLRCGQPAVLVRCQESALWLDMRSVLPEQEDDLLQALLGLEGR